MKMWTALAAILACSTGALAQNAVGLNTHVPSADELDAAVASGVTWIRIDNNWRGVEAAEGRFDWGPLDRVVDGATQRGLRVFMTVAYAPDWAHTPDGDDVPTNNVPRAGTYARYVTATVSRYRDRVQHYGMWNEPNLEQFWSGSVQQYGDVIVRPGAAAVRAACPDCLVLGPDLAGLSGWQDYLEDVLRDAGDAFDIVTHHSYASVPLARRVWACDDFDHAIDIGDDAICFYKPGLRQVLDDVGWQGTVWMTEVGYQTQPWDSEGEQRKQQRSVEGILALQQATPWWTHSFFYEIADCGPDQPGCPIDGFGLLRRTAPRDDTWADNFFRKPAFDWLQGALVGNPDWGDEPDPMDPPPDPPHPPATIIEAPHRPAGLPDGDLTDWDGRGCVRLNDWVPLEGDPPSADSLSARACAAWSDDALWLSVEVRDPLHHNPFPDDQLWRGDSVQLALDILGDGADDDDGYGPDDAEWTLAAGPNGSVIRPEYGDRPADGVVIVAPPFTRYELRVPLAALAPGRRLRGSFLVNENDGGERLGWLEWTPGIGRAKQPSAFGEIALVAREAVPPDAGLPPPMDAGPDAAPPGADAGPLPGPDAEPSPGGDGDVAVAPRGDGGLSADAGRSGPAEATATEGGCSGTPAPAPLWAMLGMLTLGLSQRRRRRR